MYSHIGKFDQRITPSSDTVYITQSAVGRSVDRQSREENYPGKKKKKKKDGFEANEDDTLVISQTGDRIAADIFDEHDEAWVAIDALLTNARARLDAIADVLMKRQVLLDGMDSDGMDDEERPAAAHPNYSVDPSIRHAIEAYQSQKGFGRDASASDMTAAQKHDIQQAVKGESTDDLETEKDNLRALIPGLETLLQNDYTHIPLVPQTSFLETVLAALKNMEHDLDNIQEQPSP